MNSYSQLLKYEKEAYLLESITSVLSWDQLCIMPEQGANYRSEQSALLAKLYHEKMSSPYYEDLIEKSLEETSSSANDSFEFKHPRLSMRKLKKRKLLPPSLVENLSKYESLGQQSWALARSKKDFSIFQKDLTKLIDLNKSKALCLKEDSKEPYNIMLEEFDYGINSSILDSVFDSLKKNIVTLLDKIDHTTSPFVKLKDSKKVPISMQKELNINLAKIFGFKSSTSNLTSSHHPFSITLGPSDYRITTRYKEDSCISSFLAVAHEMGHSLYEQGLPSKYFGTTIGQACSYGIHESQSLFWEKKIASSQAFTDFIYSHNKCYKILKDFFCEPMDLYFSLNDLNLTPIRVDSDEIRYCLHIIIRYEIEKQLFSNNLNVEDIPHTWNKMYEKYLNIHLDDDNLGCLQDVHWSGGSFGYFPSYALGHIVSSQIKEVFEKQNGNLEEYIRSGNFLFIKNWLRKNIHNKASLLEPLDLVKQLSDASIDPTSFCNYLEKKYLI